MEKLQIKNRLFGYVSLAAELQKAKPQEHVMDTLVLKKVDVPSAREAFSRIHNWGKQFAKKKGLKDSDVEKRVHIGRGIKSR